MIKVLHICADEKFIDSAITVFASLKDVNSIFYVFTKQSEKKLSFVKNPNITTFSSFEEILSIVAESNCNLVMLHSLFIPYHIVLKIKLPIIWSTWGYDIYSDTDDPIRKIFSFPLYKEKTRELLKKIYIKKPQKLTERFFSWKIHIREKQRYSRIVKKAPFFSTVLSSEFDQIKQKNPKKIYCPFHYLSEPLCPINTSKQFNSNKVLLGNSTDPTNNHLDILEKLNSLHIQLEVIIPFSYPKNETYEKNLIKGSTRFENLKICFLNTFLERDQYFNLINSCAIAIFGHLRQQAVGNIIFSLMSGKKIFFYKDSVLYNHYHNQGYAIFSIEENLNKKAFEEPLSLRDKERNQVRCLQEWDYKKQLADLQAFFDSITKQIHHS